MSPEDRRRFELIESKMKTMDAELKLLNDDIKLMALCNTKMSEGLRSLIELVIKKGVLSRDELNKKFSEVQKESQEIAMKIQSGVEAVLDSLKKHSERN